MLKKLKHSIAIILLLTSTSIFAECSYTCTYRPEDPLFEINRTTFYLNHLIFTLYVKPAAAVFDKFPLPVKESVNNFIQNIRMVPYTINSFLQGKIEQTAQNALRLVINTTLGVGGLFDVAAEMGLPEHLETLGDTFYTWGWKESSYLVIPLIGPSTIRDAWGIGGDYFMAPSAYFPAEYWNPYYLMVLINTNYRAKEVRDLVSIAGVNDYDFVRSSYLQHREYELTGEVPHLGNEGSDMSGPPD
jgi:phospholipid-binding lipoprotein MlaA